MEVLSDFLQNYAVDKNLNQIKLGEILRYGQSHFNRLYHGRMSVGPSTIRKIARILNAPDLLEDCGLSPEKRSEIHPIRITGQINAGEIINIKEFRVEKRIQIPSSWFTESDLKNTDLQFYQVSGTSMTAYGIYDNDMLLVNSTPQQLTQGTLAVVYIEGKGTVKVCWLVDDKYILHGLDLPSGKNVSLITINIKACPKIMPVIGQFRWYTKIPFAETPHGKSKQ